jgi:hypothetical protein
MEATKSVYGPTVGENLSETLVDKRFPGGGGHGANHEARDILPDLNLGSRIALRDYEVNDRPWISRPTTFPCLRK